MTRQSPVNAFKVGASIFCQARENGAGGLRVRSSFAYLFVSVTVLFYIASVVYKDQDQSSENVYFSVEYVDSRLNCKYSVLVSYRSILPALFYIELRMTFVEKLS